ncbi:MAG: site-specific integrase [Oscillospiraceae bacterium]|nr:site-specific integrase [Oscillospiraceae bacterium]
MAHKYKYNEGIYVDGVRYIIHADTKQELEEKKVKKIRDLSKAAPPITADMKVREWADHCIDTFKTRPSEKYKSMIKARTEKYVCTFIGEKKLSDVTLEDCQSILNYLAENDYSDEYIRKVNQDITFIFSRAVRNGLLHNDPSLYLEIPRGKKKNARRSITEEERTLILRTAEKDPRYVFFLVMLFCGCRPKEVSELKGSDIINDNGVDLLFIRGTKSKAAVRYVPIPPYLKERLPERKPDEYLFQTLSEKPHMLGEYDRRNLWKSFWRQLNLEAGCKTYRHQLVPPFPIADDLVPYCLRHTFATDQVAAGTDIRDTQYLMGHSSIDITADIYTHSGKETARRVGMKYVDNKIVEQFDGKNGEVEQ